jgi:hypothetical protein
MIFFSSSSFFFFFFFFLLLLLLLLLLLALHSLVDLNLIKNVLHCFRSCYLRHQFLMPMLFRSPLTDSRHLNLAFPIGRVSSGLSRVSFLQGSNSCILKRCPSILILPIFITSNMSSSSQRVWSSLLDLLNDQSPLFIFQFPVKILHIYTSPMHTVYVDIVVVCFMAPGICNANSSFCHHPLINFLPNFISLQFTSQAR